MTKVNNNLGFLAIDPYTFKCETHAGKLYALLSSEVNVDLFAKYSQVGSADGFELWRVIHKDRDPIKKDAGFHFKLEIQKFGH